MTKRELAEQLRGQEVNLSDDEVIDRFTRCSKCNQKQIGEWHLVTLVHSSKSAQEFITRFSQTLLHDHN